MESIVYLVNLHVFVRHAAYSRNACESTKSFIVGEYILSTLCLLSSETFYDTTICHEIITEIVGALNVIVSNAFTDTILLNGCLISIPRIHPYTLLNLECMKGRKMEVRRWCITPKAVGRDYVGRSYFGSVSNSCAVRLDRD